MNKWLKIALLSVCALLFLIAFFLFKAPKNEKYQIKMDINEIVF